MLRLRTSEDTRYEIQVEGATLKGAPLPASERDRIIERHTTRKPKRGRVVETRDYAAVNAAFFDQTVQSWGGVTDEQGKELDCDKKTKLLIAELNPGFIQDALDGFDRAAEGVTEAQAKNSLASPSAA